MVKCRAAGQAFIDFGTHFQVFRQEGHVTPAAEPLPGDLIELPKKSNRLARKGSEQVPKEQIDAFADWFAALGPEGSDDLAALMEGFDTPDGWIQVYAPDSKVGTRDPRGVLKDIEIIGPEMVQIQGPAQLFYRYRISMDRTALIPLIESSLEE